LEKLFGIVFWIKLLSVLPVSFVRGQIAAVRESDWPDWQKAIVLASAFVLWVAGLLSIRDFTLRLSVHYVVGEAFVAGQDGFPARTAMCVGRRRWGSVWIYDHQQE